MSNETTRVAYGETTEQVYMRLLKQWFEDMLEEFKDYATYPWPITDIHDIVYGDEYTLVEMRWKLINKLSWLTLYIDNHSEEAAVRLYMQKIADQGFCSSPGKE